jgi:hypothetical protein
LIDGEPMAMAPARSPTNAQQSLLVGATDQLQNKNRPIRGAAQVVQNNRRPRALTSALRGRGCHLVRFVQPFVDPLVASGGRALPASGVHSAAG